MNTSLEVRRLSCIEDFWLEKIVKDRDFITFEYYYLPQSVRLRILQTLVDPENFVPNESVSKEVYEKRYHVLRVLSDPEDPNFNGDYTQVPISPGVFRIAKEIEPVPLVWRD